MVSGASGVQRTGRAAQLGRIDESLARYQRQTAKTSEPPGPTEPSEPSEPQNRQDHQSPRTSRTSEPSTLRTARTTRTSEAPEKRMIFLNFLFAFRRKRYLLEGAPEQQLFFEELRCGMSRWEFCRTRLGRKHFKI